MDVRTSLLMMHKIVPFCRLQLVVETFRYSTKLINKSKFLNSYKVEKPTNNKTLDLMDQQFNIQVPKVVKLMNKITLFNNFGD